MQDHKAFTAYLVLFSLIVCGLSTATITAHKVVHFGVDFPFSNITFSVFTYPIVDCICEIWGKKLARQTVCMALACQMFIVLLLQVSIAVPAASYWSLQTAYHRVLASSGNVMIASFVAFIVSQIFDITVYQKIKEACQGKMLWLRCNISTFLGQIIDSSIFVSIVFYASHHKLNILTGSILVKIIICLLMTPVVYLIVMSINQYLDSETLAFKTASETA